MVIASAAGGMNIEEVAHETPEKIFTEKFHPDQGLFPFQVRKLSKKLGLTGAAAKVPASSSMICARSLSNGLLDARNQSVGRDQVGRVDLP